ncbi:MAG TPA: M36 family metallopeptidase [Blastocatellia bacterium]|nr:M36 family metallopeptidase [Blastocatellia bacterium]
MRKTWFLLIMIALITPSVIQLNTASADLGKAADAASSDQSPWQSTVLGLPDYDIRQELAEIRELSALKSQDENPALQARVESIENFRSTLAPERRDDLRYEMNEAGVPKLLFSGTGPLSRPAAGSPDKVARGFLAAHTEMFGLTRRDVRRMKLENVDPDGSTTFLSYNQTIDGIPLFQGQVQVAVNTSGEVLSVMEGMVIPNGRVNTTPELTEEAAMVRAFNYAGREVSDSFEVVDARVERGGRATYRNPLGPNHEDTMSELRVMRVGDRGVLVWQMFVDAGPSEWYAICVDANTGALLYRYNLYAHAAQGTVYTQHPSFSGRTLESFVGDTIINTAAGWMGTSTVTTGNNVEAYLDTDANNSPDPNNTTGLSNGHAIAANQDFTFPFVTGVDPRTQRPAVVTNLFYFCNIAHDFHYRLGFTETARNFQTNNFGRGGVGNDSVRAEAQDGSGTNNANFATPSEGQRPRMQQYLFTQGTTSLADDRDSSQDGDVVMHEYGHGVSNRLVGGGSTGCVGGTQAGAMGEGWSDYWAITFYNDGRVGDYATGNTVAGIRRAAYTVPANPVHDSYADIGAGGFQVHRDGEVWAATLWDLRTTLGAAVTDRLVLEGMKFTPCSPSFLNARDGILQADQAVNGGANRCTIWTVFARHGMGVSAVGNNGTTHVAASDVPTDCAGGTVVFLDTFETSLGWVTNPSGTDTATTGVWERGDPQDTNSSGIKQLGTTVSGINDLVTGRLAGAAAGDFDVDGGLTSVRSPAITLPSTGNLSLSFSFYLAHGSNATSADFLRVRVVSGATNTTVFQRLGAATNVNGAWSSTSVSLNSFAGQTINIIIEAADASTASLVEAGVDDVRIIRQ